MAAPGVEQISVQCSCGKRLKAPASAVGKKAKCPKCGNILTIQAPPPPTDDGLDALYELAETEKSAATDANVPRCPGCMSPLPTGAVLCTTCGFDTRSGKRLSTQKDRPGGAAPAGKRSGGSSALAAFGNTSRSQPAAAAEAPAAEGNWFIGVLLGLAFALGAGLVYGAILHVLDGIPFIRWSVLLVGWLAGVGVDKGYKGGNAVAGATAAGVTLVATIAVHLVVLAIAVVAIVKQKAPEIQKAANTIRNMTVSDVIVEDRIKQAGLNRATIAPNQLEQFQREAYDKAENLSDADYEKYKARLEPIRTKVRLYSYVHGDVMKEMHIDPFGPASDDAKAAAQREAWKRVDALTDAQKKTKLAEYESKARSGSLADEGDDEGDGAPAANASGAKGSSSSSAASSSSSSSSSSSKSGGSGLNGSAIGFGIVLVLLFLVWWYLPVVVAMALAYKVAANA